MRDRSDLQGCAVCCSHCGIRFCTHPRNARRRDLRCPFGCREHHRRQRGNARNRKYNQTDKGRANKKKLNTAARIKAGQAAPRTIAPATPVEQTSQLATDSLRTDISDAATVDESPSVDTSRAMWEHLTLHLDGFVLDEPTLVNSRVLPYVRMVASVLERRTISREELLAALRNGMRQRSIVRSPRREYVLRYLNQHPP